VAITGRFEADFASFDTAVEQSIVKLRDFDSGSAKVEASLSRMTDNFSGRKVIQEATLMAEVFDRAGGAAAFTDKELARMGATGSEAAAKLRAMGVDVPPGIQRIADEAKGADKAHGDLLGTVKNVALGFAAMFTARAAINFVNDVLADASALKDLSQQTHINVEDLQVLAGAMSEFGVDADTLGKGLFTLSRRIAGGDESVSDALATMGISLKDVQGLNGEELFLKIMRGLTTLQGGLRDDTASELFGSRLGMAMAGASEGIEGALEEAKRLGNYMSKEAIDALDKYDESIQRATRSLSAIAANMIGPVAEGFNVLADAAGKGASKWDIFVAMTKDWAASNSVTGASTVHLATLLDDLNRKTDAGTAAARASTTAQGEHAGAIGLTGKAAREAAEEVEKANKKKEAADTAYRAFQNAIFAQEIADHARMLAAKEAADTRYRSLQNEIGERMMQDEAAQMKATNDAKVAADKEWWASVNDGLLIVGEATTAQDELGAAGVSAAGAARGAYDQLNTTLASTQTAFKMAVPDQFDWTAAYQAAGIFTHGSISGSGVRGPSSLQGFASGGPVLSDGPIYAHAGEYVVPRGGGESGSTSVVNHFYVNGTGADVARIAMAEITRTMKVGRKWPAA
jgi:hypothetical protein